MSERNAPQPADAICASKAGEVTVYYEGDLGYDCYAEEVAQGKRPENERAYPLCALRAAIWRLYERKVCVLTQRRVGPNRWEYLAIRSREHPGRVAA